ncbi:spore germination protein GerPC [Neobacillus cucumis]|uniref:spore germination protein GerPC n=1 Tax=Neobacillus cucumis TaxID=1740721 RepID=UPI00196684DF|nr:spore germination protein GerPC [Neobacillus cucumis]MBM7653731.1 spore germination protein PC [Neobacillus cucumis]MED4225130.1 spore germination protein GerPC [Neobacillus cucumis]
MYQDLNQYLQWMQMCIQAHEQRIVALEQAIQQLQKQLKQVQEKPMINVDRIEYKFDQLKVETLEGTLNIGLNPNDLSGIEDFAVQNQSLNTPISPKEQMQRSMDIEKAIYEYLETDLHQIILDAQNKLFIQPNDSYFAFIKEDIIRQLPNRIDFHLKANIEKNRSEEHNASIDEMVINSIKQEIQNGVWTFLNNLPENMKGMRPE